MPAPSVPLQFDVPFDEMVERLMYRPATAESARLHQELREIYLQAAQRICALVPAGREKSLALTDLESSLKWASTAVARRDPIDFEHPDVARVLPD